MHNSLSSHTTQANTMQFTQVLASLLTSSDDNCGLRKSSSPTSQRKLLKIGNSTDSDVNRDCLKSLLNELLSMDTENKENIGSETDFSDGDDSTDHNSSSGDNFSGDDGEILSRMELWIVTSREIFFQEQLLKAMKSKHASQIKAKNDSNKIIPNIIINQENQMKKLKFLKIRVFIYHGYVFQQMKLMLSVEMIGI
ncbi:uncharacterized protein LOC141526519 [Cotesia typhae]|uniref:uncharacterized protein LOC141526519 n=1 Tax=Cotesia typhae TaxID=2053667 RepID=UPI003D691181